MSKHWHLYRRDGIQCNVMCDADTCNQDILVHGIYCFISVEYSFLCWIFVGCWKSTLVSVSAVVVFVLHAQQIRSINSRYKIWLHLDLKRERATSVTSVTLITLAIHSVDCFRSDTLFFSLFIIISISIKNCKYAVRCMIQRLSFRLSLNEWW